MMTFLRKNRALRPGVTPERRRVLADAGTNPAEHPALRDAYVTDVHPVVDVEAAFSAALAPRPGQSEVAVDTT
jgi:hypothetical protein